MEAFRGLRIATSGLSAERLRMDTISSNIANAETTKGEDGKPYVRKVAVFQSNLEQASRAKGNSTTRLKGIKAVGIEDDDSELPRVYNPTHQDADEEGFVTMPNVEITNEMVDLMVASRAYEANVSSFEAQKSMFMKTLEIGK